MGCGVKKFVKFPEMWRVQLAEIRASGNTYRVALYLLERARWMSPGNRRVTLSTTTLRRLGVNRDGKRTALQQLRKAGLGAVEERPKRSPIVTVRFVE
jgi:hypothetical protein